MTLSPTKCKRTRRTAEDAKRVILDAAERLVSRAGPAGLRLQDVAAEVGLTHSVILHHFGNREGLMRALNQRVLEDLRLSLKNILQTSNDRAPDVLEQMLESVFTVFRSGLAQRLVWLGSTRLPSDEPSSLFFQNLVDVLHQHRLCLSGDTTVPREDTQMMIYLVAMAAVGDAVIGGDLLNHSDNTAEAASRRGFRSWLSRLLQAHLNTGHATTA